MHPLTLQQVAEKTSLHESTVSRSTTRKYINTPFGTIELKSLFSSKLKNSDGEDISSTAIKENIKKSGYYFVLLNEFKIFIF